jgi:hypothetical protein
MRQQAWQAQHANAAGSSVKPKPNEKQAKRPRLMSASQYAYSGTMQCVASVRGNAVPHHVRQTKHSGDSKMPQCAP